MLLFDSHVEGVSVDLRNREVLASREAEIRRETLQYCGSNSKNSRGEQISKADIAVHLGTHAVCDAIDNFGTILRGIDMKPEWTLSEKAYLRPSRWPGQRRLHRHQLAPLPQTLS
jgi:hypothetical protein